MPRYDHENFGSVQEHIFMKGTITSVNSSDDTADVAVPGGSDGSAVPLFYHCDPDSDERGNGAIEGAAEAFNTDDEVIVMATVEGDPVRVVGFVDGIKECGSNIYLVISSAAYYWRAYYILWDVIEGKLVDSVTYGDTLITFPYEAPFTMVKGVQGETIARYYPTDEPDEDGVYEYQKDPFYKWLMRRPWPPQNWDNPLMCPDPDHIGIPAWPTTDALLFTEVGPYSPTVGVNLPSYGAACSTECRISLPRVTSDQCEDSDDAVAPARFQLGDLGMVNAGQASYAASCTLDYSTGSGTFEKWGSSSIISSSTLELASVPRADHFNEPYSNPVTSTGPFLTAVIAHPSDPDTIISGLYQPETRVFGTSNVDEWVVGGTVSMASGFNPTGCAGSNESTDSESCGFTFDTPLGALDPIAVGGGFTGSYGSCKGVNAEYSILGVSPVWKDHEFVETFVDAKWEGLDSEFVNKNMYHCKFAMHGDVMYQIYYYSAFIISETKSGTSVYSPHRETVISEGMTSHLEAVAYFPDGDAIEADPLMMSADSEFTSAIEALFEVAKAENERDIVWNLDVNLFH